MMHTLLRRYIRMLRLTVLTGVAAALLSAPVSAETVLKFVPQADLKNTDPIWTTANITLTHGFVIYDMLFGVDHKGVTHPQMVDTYTINKEKTLYSFTLREGLRWHDGTPVRAADCVASIKRWAARDTFGQKMMALVDKMEVVNDRTFRIKMKRPFGLVVEALGKYDSNAAFMMREKDAMTDPYTQVTSKIGSGPFIMKTDEWEPGHKVVYVKNKDYKPRPEPVDWFAGGKIPKVDRIEWIYIPDQATALAALQRGEVDYLDKPELDFVPMMEKDPNIVVKPIPEIFQGYMAINWLWPPFNNIKARRALLYMVNQEDYVRSIIGNPKFFMKFCGAMFICGTQLATDAGDGPLKENNLAKARQLMKESGYKGEPVVLMDPTDFPVLHGAALVTAQKLRQIGVNVDLQAMDWSTLTSRRAEKKSPKDGGWNLFHTWWTSGSLERPVSHPGVSGACDKAWFGWPCDKKMQELSNAWALEPDAAKRKQIATQLQKRAYQVVAYVPFGQWQAPLAYRKELKGLQITPVATFWNVTK